MGNKLNNRVEGGQIKLKGESLVSSNLQGAGNDTDEGEECAGRHGERVGSVEFHDLVKTNVGTDLAKHLASRLEHAMRAQTLS